MEVGVGGDATPPPLPFLVRPRVKTENGQQISHSSTFKVLTVMFRLFIRTVYLSAV